MDAIKRGAIFLTVAFVLGLLLAFVLPRETGRAAEDKKLLVGVGDDITGRLTEQILQRYSANGEESLAQAGEGSTPLQVGGQDLDSYLFIDCCSNAGQWSLLTKDIDLGFYCSHISMAIVNQSEGFSIYGPAVMNGEVLGYWENPEDIRTMAIPMKREHLAELVREEYPWVEEIKEISATSILYAFGDRQVDGAVMDIARAFQMPEYQYTRVSEQDYVSYCLVVRDDIVDTPQFETFIRFYNETVEALNDKENLQALYGMDDAFWEAINLKFLYLPEL